MNKNKEVLVANYDSVTSSFSSIYDILDINYAPYIISKSYKLDKDIDNLRGLLSNWFKNRGIPSWRDKLDLLLNSLNINVPTELLDKAFGLSLSDQYWLKPYDSNIKYEDINFFENDFDYSEFLEASLSSNSKKLSENSLKTPNNTTDGMLRKAWVIDNGIRYLIKGGYKNEVLQPFNEVLASNISNRLGFNHVEYILDAYKDMVVSKCPCFIDTNTELITAYQIMYKEDGGLNTYIKILEDNGIIDPKKKLYNMYTLDYLILNEDRHLNNFGIIRDVNTLKWLDVAPIFDNGQSLNITDYDDSIIINGNARLFYDVMPFDEMISKIDISNIDLNKLNGIVEEFDYLLNQYQSITNMSNKHIHNLCVVLNNQIKKLKDIQKG